jgi:mannonate dehydratase
LNLKEDAGSFPADSLPAGYPLSEAHMIQIAEMLSSQPDTLWKLVKQVGVDYAVGPLPYDDTGGEAAWDYQPLRRLKERYESAGLEFAVIESSPPMQKIRLGMPGRDEEIEQFKTLLRNMGALGIPVICYNFMAIIGWTRTHIALPARGGAVVTGYDHESMRAAPLTEAGEVPEERLWENLRYFLERVIPTAEKSGVKLAMHPDDPPLSPLRGIGRIMRSVEGFQRLIDLVPSENNGITLCQGNFALMTDDLPGVIRGFGAQQRIAFVHFRDVRGTAENFVETFHDEGPTDMLACMRAYREIGFNGVLRPDHVPTLEGDSNDNPCYSSVGRIFAIGYIKGLREAVYGKDVEPGPAGSAANG